MLPQGFDFHASNGKKLWPALVRICAVLLSVLILIYLTLLGVNWRDQPPSAAALRLDEMQRNRPSVADSNNGYVFALGFSAPADQDPHALGLRQIEWLRRFSDHPRKEAPPGEPARSSADFRRSRQPAIRELSDACIKIDSACAAALEGADRTIEQWLDSEQWLLRRYETLLRYEGWQEKIAFMPQAPLPGYGAIYEGQKLLLAHAWWLAGTHDAGAVNALLAADMRFWRRVLAAADVLLTKMIATGALRRHFAFSHLILRRLPIDLALQGMPQQWQQEISSVERSMQRCLLGEWLFANDQIMAAKNHGTAAVPVFAFLEDTFVEDFVTTVAITLFQPQDSSNQAAGAILRAIETLTVPYEQYSEALAQSEKDATLPKPSSLWSRLYNITGDKRFSNVDYSPYAARVADLEGMRRAVVLAARLRNQGFSRQRIPEQLRAAAIRDPFTGEPFEWDSAASAIVFTGLEASARSRHSYPY